MDKVEQTITDVLQREGSAFTDDPKDSGGPTKWGITQATLSRYLGRPASRSEVEALDERTARAVYRFLFVDEPGYTAVLQRSEAIGSEVIDTGVNMGPPRATMMLQAALNGLNRNGRDYPDIAEDGRCGAGTIAALTAYLAKRGREGETVLLRALNCQQGAYYLDLARRRPKDEEYLYGWLRERVVA